MNHKEDNTDSPNKMRAHNTRFLEQVHGNVEKVFRYDAAKDDTPIFKTYGISTWKEVKDAVVKQGYTGPKMI